MFEPYYSFIIPVYNRPDEVSELLESLTLLKGGHQFEVVIVEDGSQHDCKDVCERFRESVTLQYHYKANSGPGDSRNYGMRLARGNYFIILDSDCVIPPQYLNEVTAALSREYVDCYGGPDAAEEHFSSLQKAINFTMTSWITTGGIRGGSENLGKFQPRSFNMGLSKKAFESSGGFGKIHPGEDPDLSIRLWKLGFETRLFPDAFVYHKRRISFPLFYKQVHKFGMVRVILNKWHPQSAKITYYLPSLFLIVLLSSLALAIFGHYEVLIFLSVYLVSVGIISSFKNGVYVGLLSIIAIIIQFVGYGYGFIKATAAIKILKREERTAFNYLFFK